MTQPDLVSKLREVSAKWREEAASMKEALSNFQAAAALGMEQCAAELESLLGLEGQAARCNYYFGGVDGGNRCQKAIHDADEGHEWRSDREGQSAQPVSYRTENISSHPIACGPSQPEPPPEEQPAVVLTGATDKWERRELLPPSTPIRPESVCPTCGFIIGGNNPLIGLPPPTPQSTPIVPGTAGLSAEQVRAELCPSCQATDNNPYTDSHGQQMRACGRCMIQWVARPAPAGEVKGEK